MQKYAIYFEQVNQSKYVVDAKDRASAIKKAARSWREDFGTQPRCSYVEELTEKK